jgi:hypothetical protein
MFGRPAGAHDCQNNPLKEGIKGFIKTETI